MLSENEKRPKNILTPFHTDTHTCTHHFILTQKIPKGKPYKDVWNSSESSILDWNCKEAKMSVKTSDALKRVVAGVQEIPGRRFWCCVSCRLSPQCSTAPLLLLLVPPWAAWPERDFVDETSRNVL